MYTKNQMTGFYITPTVKWNGRKWFTQIKFRQKKSTSRMTCLKSVILPRKKRFSKPFNNAYKPILSNIASAETSHLMCTENEVTGFYRKTTLRWIRWRRFAQKSQTKEIFNKGMLNKALSNCGPLNGPCKPTFLQEMTMTVPSDPFRRASYHKNSIFK